MTAMVGGRPGMISGPSGLTALVIGKVMTFMNNASSTSTTDDDINDNDDTLGLLYYSVMFAGVLQCLSTLVGLGRLASNFPGSPVMVGMVNGMAVLALAMQLRCIRRYDDDTDLNGS